MDNETNNDSTPETNRVILTGRIYPAIQKCVGNRYKILVGYFGVFGYLLSSKSTLETFSSSGALLLLTIVFTAFTLHNSVNYWINASEQSKFENKDTSNPAMEVAALIVILGLIWGGFCLLRTYASAA